MEFHKYLNNKHWKLAINQSLYLTKQHWTVKYKHTLGNGRFLFTIAATFAIVFGCTLFIVHVILAAYTIKRIFCMQLSYKYDNLGIRLELMRTVLTAIIGGGLIIILFVIRDIAANDARLYNDGNTEKWLEIGIWIVQCCVFNMFMFIALPWVRYDMIVKSRTKQITVVKINTDDASIGISNNTQLQTTASMTKLNLIDQNSEQSAGTQIELAKKSSNSESSFINVRPKKEFTIVYQSSITMDNNSKDNDKTKPSKLTSRWQNVIASSLRFEALMNHLQTEFSTENLLFLTEVKILSNIHIIGDRL